MRKSNSYRQRNEELEYSALEPRQLLAGVSSELFNGFNSIVIEGTLSDDRVNIRYNDVDDPSRVFVNFNGDFHAFGSIDEIERVVFLGRQGDDTFINRTNLNATVYAHEGNDHIVGGNGHNRIQGGPGNDTIIGGDRNDFLRGRDGNDIISPGRRHDIVHGGNGDDLVLASGGNDRILGENGNDTLGGGSGSDRINGGPGVDNIDFGEGFQDFALFDRAFADYNIAEDGDRLIVSGGGQGIERITGARTLRFANADRAASNFFVDFNATEQRVFDLINDFRLDRDLSPLVPVNDITNFTEQWTNDVLTPLGHTTGQELFDHHSTELGGYMPLIIDGREAYTEISGFYPDPNATGPEAMSIIFNGVQGFPGSGWRDSPFHFTNITDPDAYEVGIGAVRTNNGWYVTVGFGLKRLPS